MLFRKREKTVEIYDMSVDDLSRKEAKRYIDMWMGKYDYNTMLKVDRWRKINKLKDIIND
jgi:hypothetical protein